MFINYHFRWVVLTFFCIMMSITIASSEELSLNQAVELALKNNPSIASGKFLADAAKQEARGARALNNPEISVAPNIIGDAGSDSAVFFSQPFEINGSRRVRIEIADYQAASAHFDAAAVKRDIILQVKQTYWDAARAQEMVRLNQDNLQYIETLRAVVQKQYDVGAVPGSLILKTDVEIARARQELSMAQLEQAQAKATMNALLNRPKNLEFSAADSLVFLDKVIEREKFQSIALSNRPEAVSAKAQTDAALRQVRAVQIRSLPDLSIQARKETFDADSGSGIALVISLPLLDWGSVKADKKRAVSASQSQEKQLEAVRNSISLDVEHAVQLVETSSRIVHEYHEGILNKSEELAQMAQIGYEKGATSYLEVLEAQRTFRSIKTEYYTALANSSKSIVQLEWAIGCKLNDAKEEVKK